MPNSPHLLLLGTGTSAGVPIIGCDCPTCTSSDPRDQRLRTSACLRFPGPDGAPRVILIDTSPDLRQQSLTHDLRRCDGIVYTHNHVDHIFGLDEVRRFNILMDASIDVHADDHTMESLHRVYRHIFRRDQNVNDSFVATLIPHVIDPDQPFSMHGLRFTPLRLLHGRLPVLGYRIETLSGEPWGPFPLAYCTDVSSIPPETWPHLTGLRTLVLDMLRPRHHPTHLTVDQAVEIATQVEAEQTIFVHMTHDILHAELTAELPKGMALGFDGQIVGEP